MSSHPRVSIIIPIYNAEQDLSDCLQSAVQQTIRDMEIVCVDDASTDSSVQIVANYSAADSRIRLLKHGENKGEGASRNTGIDSARGDYIFHLDADDTLPANAIELLYSEASDNDSDMVKGGFSIISSAGELEKGNLATLDRKVINTNIHDSRFLQSIPSSHCSYLYRRQLLNDNCIRYRTNLAVGLDLIALMSALTRAKNVTIIPQSVYNYRQSNSGVSRSHFSSKNPIQAIWAKRIMYEELLAIGLTQAAENIFKKWKFQIFNYWLRMPEYLSIQDSRSVFFEFRASLPPLVTPWENNIGHHHRFILALIYAGRDDEAIEFLKTSEASKGFNNSANLRTSLEFVLTIAPNDIASLYELGRIAQSDGHLTEAAAFSRKQSVSIANISTLD